MRQVFITISLLILLSGCGSSEQAAQRPHENIQFPESKTFEIPEVERFQYNGIEFFLLQDNELPLIHVNVLVNGGSWLDPEDEVGLASLTGTVIRSGGSEQYPEEDLNELLENRAASMETGFGLTTGSARMNVLKEDFNDLLPVFTNLLNSPLLPQERLDLAKTRQRTAISRRNEDASTVASREFRKLIYGDQSVFSRIIEYENLENISIDDIAVFHEKVFKGSNMMVGIVGDFEVESIRNQLEEAFGIFDEGEPMEIDLPEVDYEFEPGLYFANKSDMNQSQIRMGHIGGYRDNPDYASLQVMNQILSGGFSGRLMQEVRTNQGLAYSVYGSYGSNVRYPGVFFTGLSTASENTAEALEATIIEIKRLQEEPVTQEELDETKERIFNRIIFRYDSYFRILAERMNNYNLGLPEDAFDRYIEEVRNVTVEDIYRVANEYLQPENLKMLIVGNKSLIEDQLAILGDYNEIDISIPRPESQKTVVEGDTEAGTILLERMADAIIEERNEIKTLVLKGEQIIQTPQGEMAMDITSETTFPDDITIELHTPMGNQVIEISNGQGLVKMGGQEQQLPGSTVQSILDGIKRNPLFLAMNASELQASQIETETSSDHLTLYIGGEYDLILQLHPESYLPEKITYSEFDQEKGREVESVIQFENWTAGDGVRIAYIQNHFSDGELVSSSRYHEHRIP